MKNCENISWLGPSLVTSSQCKLFFFFCQPLYSATFIHSQSRMIQITFCFLSFRSTLISLILVSFWFILLSFLLVPVYSGVIRFHSRVIPPCSGIFRFIPLHLCVIPPHSGVIPVSFRLVSVYSGTILVHSVSFRYIPVRSVPFLGLVTPVTSIEDV